ncbi:hypothetical protein N9A54_02425 [Porticoccaceae bacterium]|nr:hypothetical protein [Porticoccaceae bacterium]
MTPEKFAQLASQNFNRIPVTREVLADLETPLSVYLKLAQGANSYLFESVQGGEKWGRYSLIGLQTSTVLKVFGNRLEIIRDGKPMVNRSTADPLAEVERFRQLFSMPNLPELPRFTGGLVGYFGYDTVRFVEPRLAKSAPKDDLQAPDILLLASDEVARSG